jgi:hypothetical protein
MSETKGNVVVWLEEVCEIVRKVADAEIDEGEGLARCLIVADTHNE